ncbi:hypothetical protein [Streptomyces xinghaiensis]|uniref:hypothetical protein n=1 Tax=Streptomyces xinghaiensis TaxID=1038928 RepID=UPI00031EBA62|nr:hypothetical protein [Streptomyces xinghaiensis]MZE80909.1 hypothetical protein [Streptomyces sp. SID5475]
MPVIALAGCTGAPGVTTTALALLMTWPLQPGRRVVMAECDPDGGAVLHGILHGALGDTYGMKNLSLAARKGELTEAFWRQLIDMTDGEGVQDPPRDRLVLPGFTDPAQAAGMAPAWEALADLFTGIERHPDYPHDVVIDLGRRGAFGASAVLAQRADAVAVVARSTLRGLQSAQARVTALEQQVGGVGLLLIEEGPYRTSEVEKVLKAPVVARLPHRPELARVLSDGAAQPRRFTQSDLMRSARGAVGPLLQRAALRRARLDPRRGRGEVTGAR